VLREHESFTSAIKTPGAKSARTVRADAISCHRKWPIFQVLQIWNGLWDGSHSCGSAQTVRVPHTAQPARLQQTPGESIRQSAVEGPTADFKAAGQRRPYRHSERQVQFVQ
jgi:hypothetical protein